MNQSAAKKVGVLFFHPFRGRSKVGASHFSALRSLPGLTCRDMYEEVPDFALQVEKEQAFLSAHDVIVFLHPVYWYSVPALMKEWIDATLELGWAYGEGGTALAGKVWAQAVSTGGPEMAYSPSGFHKSTLKEFFRPLQRTAELCSMRLVDPYVVYGARHLSDAQIEAASRGLVEWVKAL